MADHDAPEISRLRIDRGGASSARGAGTPRRFRRPWRIAAGVLLLAVVVLVIGSMLNQPIPVETSAVTTVSATQSLQTLIASGYVVAQRKAAVASKGTGRLVQLSVVEGDRVAAGTVLARIESADIEAAVAQARASLEQARAAVAQAEAEAVDAAAAHARATSLLASSSLSRADFDVVDARHKRASAGVRVAEAAVRAAEAAVRAAAVQLENTYIRAPFAGTVLTKNADVGEVVAPFGAAANARGAVVTMADMRSLEVEADVSESQIQNVRPEQPCEITLDAYPTRRYRGRVNKIVPTADRSKATVLTKVRFEDLDERVLPEMSAKVAFLSAEPPAGAAAATKLAAHPDAVVTRNGARVVFVVKDDTARMRTVTTGERSGSLLEIRSGLTAGEQVVVRPPDELKDGDVVSIGKK